MSENRKIVWNFHPEIHQFQASSTATSYCSRLIEFIDTSQHHADEFEPDVHSLHSMRHGRQRLASQNSYYSRNTVRSRNGLTLII